MPALARSILLTTYKYDSGGAGQRAILHPLETFAANKQVSIYNQVAGLYMSGPLAMALINQKFTYIGGASGTATAQDIFDLAGYWLAVA